MPGTADCAALGERKKDRGNAKVQCQVALNHWLEFLAMLLRNASLNTLN